MVRSVFGPCLVVLAVVGGAAADEPVFSGPQPGEKITPFKVLGYSGPHAGKEVELLDQIKGAPTLLVFVHEVTRPAFQLIRPLDLYGSRLAKDGFATHFVWLGADKTKAREFLDRARGSLNLKSPIGISLDGLEGPGNYGLNRKVTLTLILARGNKVTANFALVQPNETDAPKVLAEMAKLAGQKAPALEELRKELDAQRQPLTDRPKAKGKEKGKKGEDLPGKSPSDPELIALMRRMIQKDNDEAAVKEVAAAMTKWAGKDEVKKTELTEFCKRVAYLKYGSEHAQKAIRQLAEGKP